MSKFTYHLKVQDPEGAWIEADAVFQTHEEAREMAIGVARRLDTKVAIVRRPA